MGLALLKIKFYSHPIVCNFNFPYKNFGDSRSSSPLQKKSRKVTAPIGTPLTLVQKFIAEIFIGQIVIRILVKPSELKCQLSPADRRIVLMQKSVEFCTAHTAFPSDIYLLK